MKILALLLASLALAAPASDPDSQTTPRTVILPDAPLQSAPDCEEDRIHLAERRETVAPQRLGDLPPASMEQSVWYRENGCTVPVVVKQDIER